MTQSSITIRKLAAENDAVAKIQVYVQSRHEAQGAGTAYRVTDYGTTQM